MWADLFRARNGTFEFGTVVGIDMAREQYSDGTSTQYPSGLLMIRLNTEVQIKVPYMMPSAGKSQFVGSMPELGTVALLCNVGTPEAASHVVLGFMPVPICKMVAVRKEMSRITPGETVIQASANGGDDFWRGARTKWDEYGRFVVTSGDEDLQIIVGDALSNEYTPNVSMVKDAITGATVIYKLKMKDCSTTVTRDGSIVERWNRILQEIAGDWLTVLKGKFVVSSGDQIRLSAKGEDANYLSISGAGIRMGSIGSFIAEFSGRVDIETADALVLSSMLDMVYQAGGSLQLKAAKDLLLTCSGSINGTAPQGDIAFTAGKTASLLAATTVFLQSAAASQQVIRGDLFLQWLATPGALVDSTGAPITSNPLIPVNPITMPDLYLSSGVKVP